MVYRSSRIKLSTGQICWREAGDSHRPVLIFLHGSWHDSSQWTDVMEPLSQDFHCFALDLLGFGNSTATQVPNSIDMEVDCLHEFLNALKLRSVYLIGHSLGGWIAINYALKYPNTTQGLVTISPEGFSLTNWQQYDRLTKWLLAHPYSFKLWLFGLRVLVSVSDGAKSLEEKQNYWSFFEKFPTTCRLFFQRSKSALSSELAANNLFKLKAPILILQSDKDDLLTIEQSKAYAQAIRNSEYQWIRDLESNSPQLSIWQIVKEIISFTDRVQLKIDREEVELW